MTTPTLKLQYYDPSMCKPYIVASFDKCYGCGLHYLTGCDEPYWCCRDEEDDYDELFKRLNEYQRNGFRRCRVHASGHIVCSQACASECQCEEVYTLAQNKRANNLVGQHHPDCEHKQKEESEDAHIEYSELIAAHRIVHPEFKEEDEDQLEYTDLIQAYRIHNSNKQ
jgi:hypothetical protein